MRRSCGAVGCAGDEGRRPLLHTGGMPPTPTDRRGHAVAGEGADPGCLADEQSLLLLSPPGVGKSDVVAQAAAEAGLAVPVAARHADRAGGRQRHSADRRRAVGVLPAARAAARRRRSRSACSSTNCPPAPPDVQKAFYSLLLERRLGEHALPQGNVGGRGRQPQRGPGAGAHDLERALVNRVFVVQVRVDVEEWLALGGGQRRAVGGAWRSCTYMPEALQRPVPAEPVPFSTPRAWAMLVARHSTWPRRPGELDTGASGGRSAFGRRHRRTTPRCSAPWPRRGSATCGRSTSTSTTRPCCRRRETAMWFLVSRTPASGRQRARRTGRHEPPREGERIPGRRSARSPLSPCCSTRSSEWARTRREPN